MDYALNNPAKFVYQCAGIPVPQGQAEVPSDTRCILTGKPIAAHTFATPWRMSDGFVDRHHLAYPEGAYVLPEYGAFLRGNVMANFSYVFVHPDLGIRKISKSGQIKWLFEKGWLDRPPFLMIYCVMKRAHTIWRSRVTLSPNYVQIFGPKAEKLVASTQRCREALVVSKDLIPHVSSKTELSHIWKRLTMKLEAKSPEHGEIRGDVRQSARERGAEKSLEQLDNLSLGDTWLLTSLVSTKPSIKPEPVKLNLKS